MVIDAAAADDASHSAAARAATPRSRRYTPLLRHTFIAAAAIRFAITGRRCFTSLMGRSVVKLLIDVIRCQEIYIIDEMMPFPPSLYFRDDYLPLRMLLFFAGTPHTPARAPPRCRLFFCLLLRIITPEFSRDATKYVR